MRVAFATSDCERVDEEFRRASHLVVFELTPAGFRLDRVFAFPAGGRFGTDVRIRAVHDAAIVYVAAMGPSTAARLGAHGIQPATAPAGSPIRDLLAQTWRLAAARILDERRRDAALTYSG
jgi:nitrogen fixation protein NifX